MSNPSLESSVFVEFYTDAVHMKADSEKEGRPIYKDMPHVRIIIPGDTGNIIETLAKEQHKQKYPEAWKRFQTAETTGHTGTQLEHWPQITRSQVKEAKYYEVHTVEQMAGLSDAHVAKLGMGFSDLRAKAKAFLSLAEDTAAATKQAAENERQQREIDDLKAQIKEMGKRKHKETAEA